MRGVPALLALAPSAASMSIAAGAGREVVNFDFAWRVLPDTHASTFHGSCDIALKQQTSHQAVCTKGVSFGCDGDDAMLVTKGCRGTFTCNGKDVTCDDYTVPTLHCRCDGQPPAPPAPPGPAGVPAQAAPGFDDAAWEVVDCPHDFLITGEHDKANSNKQGFLPRGNAWYRKHFKIPAEWKGSSVWVYVEGAYHSTQAYFNGAPLGERHKQGYTSFWLRLDAGARWGEENVLAIRVVADSGTGWWYEGGGLNRHSYLVRAAPLHLAPDRSWAHANVTGAVRERNALRPAAGLAADAVLVAEAGIANAGAAAAAATVRAAVYDESGAQVAAGSAPASVAAAGASTVSVRLPVAAAELWSVARPYLYTVRLTVEVAGEAVDEVNITTGVRSIEFDADEGFKLNGKDVKIRGFCDHSNFGGVGSAVPDRVNLFRVQTLRMVGGNSWRMAHNPPIPSRLDIMDRLGFLAMDENRDYGGQHGQGGNTEETVADELVDMADMVQRDRSHPSIIIWSFCNEVGCNNNTAAKDFRAVAYKYDGTRPVTQNHLGSAESTEYLDVQGLSHKGGGNFDSFHKSNPEKPEMATECCSCLSQRGEDQDFCPSPKDGVTCPGAPTGTFYNNEISQCTAKQVAASDSRKYVAGTYVWSGFDYLGESRGFPQTLKCRGTVADIAGFAKETAYWMRAWWLSNISAADHGRPDLAGFAPPATTVYFPETWKPPPSGSKRTVHVYSNAPEVELLLNGASVGKAAMPFFGTATFSVDYADGNLTAVARGADGAELATFSKSTERAAASLRGSVDAPSPSTGTGAALVVDGEDTAMVRAELLDASGALATGSSANVTFTVVSGPGRVSATHSGEPASWDPAHGASHSAYHGLARAFIRTTVDAATPAWHRRRLREIDGDGGRLTAVADPDAAAAPLAPIVVRISAAGLPDATVSIPVTADLAEQPLNVAARRA